MPRYGRQSGRAAAMALHTLGASWRSSVRGSMLVATMRETRGTRVRQALFGFALEHVELLLHCVQLLLRGKFLRLQRCGFFARLFLTAGSQFLLLAGHVEVGLQPIGARSSSRERRVWCRARPAIRRSATSSASRC